MGISYIATNPVGQRWQVTKESTYEGSKPTDNLTKINLWNYAGVNNVWSVDNPGPVFDYTSGRFISPTFAGSVNSGMQTNLAIPIRGNPPNPSVSEQIRQLRNNEATNNQNAADNATNEANKKANNSYDQVLSIANSTTGGDYLAQKARLDALDVSAQTKIDFKNSFDAFYNNEKVSPWDIRSAAKPPSPGGTKDLDTNFYKEQVPAAAQQWADAVAKGDLDILSRYGDEDTFLRAHYTTQGKQNGIRGYAAQEQKDVKNYVEKPTDTDRQQIADIVTGEGTTVENLITKILGPKEKLEKQQYGALAQNVLKDTIAQINKVKAQESQWDLYRNLDSFVEIADMNKTLANSILGDSGVGGYLALSKKKSEDDLSLDLEKQFSKITGIQSNVTYNWQKWFDETLTAKYGIDYKQFQGTEDTLDVVNAALKTDQNKIFNKTKKEFTTDFIKEAGFKTNTELVNFLSKQGNTGTSLLTKLQSAPETLKTDLETLKGTLEKTIKDLDAQKNRNLKLTYTGKADIPEQMEIEASFARSFIDEYLKPRFDYSKSMNEFKDYLDINENEKNIFQTTDRITEIKQYATNVAKAIQPDLATKFDSNFDYGFYYNPKDDTSTQKQQLYNTQKETVAKDWENAKNNPNSLIDPELPYLGTWAENAYYYGDVDLKNKEAFAKLHYQVKGRNQGFDAAFDPASRLKLALESPLYTKAQSLGTVFGKFTEPKEYVDELFKNIDPLENKTEWRALLEKYGLDANEEDLEVVKNQIVELLTTGAGYEIRKQIEELKKEEKTPTQANLGVTYIERPEDKPVVEKSALYDVFKKAGFTGTEKEFYNQYMPDTSVEDIKFLSDAAKGKTPTLDLSSFTDIKDPFGVVNKLENIFNPPKKTTDTATAKDSYFKLIKEEDENTTPTPESFLSEFTSFLKK
jgi:hypothetical protein